MTELLRGFRTPSAEYCAQGGHAQFWPNNIKFVINGKYTDPIWLTLGVKQGNDSENCGGITLLFTFQVVTYPHSFLVFS